MSIVRAFAASNLPRNIQGRVDMAGRKLREKPNLPSTAAGRQDYGRSIVPGSAMNSRQSYQVARNANARVRRSAFATQNGGPCPRPLRLPSLGMMAEATTKALRSVPGGGRSSPLTSEFSKVASLPDFRSGGWRSEASTHSRSAFEHDLGNTGKVVKVYVGDRNFNSANTVTITDPTESVSHYAAWPLFKIGIPVNARNAAVYLSRKGC